MKKEKSRQTAEKKLKLMQQRVDKSEYKCKGDFCGREPDLHLQTWQGTVDAATGNEVVVPVCVGRQNIPIKCRCGKANHLRITYAKCKLNPKIIAQAKAEEEAIKAPDGHNMQCKFTNVVKDGDKMVL